MVFPITATPPSYYTQIRSTYRHGNVFYKGETGNYLNCVTFASAPGSWTNQPFTGSYVIRDYYGAIVTTGTLSAAVTIPIPDGLPCGGYSVFLTQSVNDATYGYAAGCTRFLMINPDARFPTFVGVAAAGASKRGHLGDDCFMHGLTMQGPRRDVNNDPTNTGYDANIHTGATLDRSWYLANPDSARPRPLLCTSVNLITATAQWQAAVNDYLTNYGITWFEGPANEPGGSAATIATELQSFSQVTKAGNPNAKVLGPCSVTFNNSMNQVGTGFTHNVLANLAAMTPLPIDGVSFHSYNCYNGDLSLGRKVYQQLVDTLTSVGLQDLPRWDTEQGQIALEHGTFMPRMQGRWTMGMLLLEEQYGIPKEHHVIFSDAYMGDDSFPSFYSTDGYFPAVGMMRAFSAEVWGKTFTNALDFGTPGNDMLLGSLYSGADGTATLAFHTAGSTDLTVTLAVTGASTLTVVDCFGNTSTVTVGGGSATIGLGMEPVYVRLPAGATATVVQEWNTAALGADLARTSTATASGTQANVSANAARMVDGNQISSYYNNQQPNSRSTINAPYIDDTNAFPAWARFDWASAQTLDRVVVFAAPPEQQQGTLLDFDVQWLDADGTTWHTAQTIAETAKFGAVNDPTANVLPNVAHANMTGCTVESFFSDRWVFPVRLASKVTTKALRLYIRGATYGECPTLESWTAQGAANTTAFGNNFTIRSVQAFNSVAAAPPPAGNPFVVRTIT